MQGIYIIKNKITNQVYVGQSVDLKKRKVRHLKNLRDGNYKEFNKLYPAMKSYGIEDFEFVLIEKCDKEKLSERELYWINHYDSINTGYNVSHGKSGGIGYWLGKHRYLETNKKISEKLKGSTLPEEVKRKIGETNKTSMLGNTNGNKKIICIETGEVFNSVKDAGLSINRNPGGISLVLKGKKKTCGGYTWSYFVV